MSLPATSWQVRRSVARALGFGLSASDVYVTVEIISGGNDRYGFVGGSSLRVMISTATPTKRLVEMTTDHLCQKYRWPPAFLTYVTPQC